MINTITLFPLLNEHLRSLLASLNDEDWEKPTLARQWCVKDVVAHLLDTSIRSLAVRDKYGVKPDRPLDSYNDLVGYLNDLNADWVKAAQRMSPQVLAELSHLMGKQQAEYFAKLDMRSRAPFGVAWAGQETSPMWFHIAREYTERWHHQQQIREAVGKTGIMTRHLFFPCIDTFMQGLPHTYRNTPAATGTTVEVIVETGIGGRWFLTKAASGWVISSKMLPAVASISIPPDVSWKLFTKGINAEEARKQVTITGDEALASVVLNMVSVMA